MAKAIAKTKKVVRKVTEHVKTGEVVLILSEIEAKQVRELIGSYTCGSYCTGKPLLKVWEALSEAVSYTAGSFEVADQGQIYIK